MFLDLSLVFIIFGLIGFWLTVLSILLIQTILHYRRLTKDVTKKDLKSVLTKILDQTKIHDDHLTKLDSEVAVQRRLIGGAVQKLNLVRFNPFNQTGGDQSFSLAFLDEHNSGYVLSSLHSRDLTRFYAKKVTKGEGDGYDLSKEEKQAIATAK